ncbi:MAG: secretin N-terminal domain-containing protein [Candidatus Omnitrophota bacterium]
MKKIICVVTILLMLTPSVSFTQNAEQEPADQSQEISVQELSVEESAPLESITAQPTIEQNKPQQETQLQATRSQTIVSARTTKASGPDEPGKVSLDIKGMDIVDVLKMLATRSSMNIVIGKNVTGRVTLFLKNIDVWDAFEIVILSNDLAYEKKGDIVNIMSQRDYELQYGQRFQDKKSAKTIKLKYAKAQDVARSLNQLKTNIGKIVVDDGTNTLSIIDTPQSIKEIEAFIEKTDLPFETKIFHLNYAQAEKLNPKIQEIITKGVGTLRIDERTNKIVVTDYPAKITEISEVVAAFDEKTPQVLIDAQIIEIKPSDKFEMGVDWDYWIEKYFRASTSLPIGTSNRMILSTATTTPTQPGDYKAIIDALRTIGDTKILSSPRIMVMNNQEAKILVGTKDAYITSTVTQTEGNAVTAESVNFVETGIKLFVTPVINSKGFVIMKIKPEVSSAETKTIISQDKRTEVPIVTSSETETTVMVKDGVTIIIGGLRKDEHKKTVKKVPILGDIPGLRYFFSSTSDEINKTDLIILLTPHIMSGESAYIDFAQIQPQDGSVVSMVGGNIVKERIVNPKNKIPGQVQPENYYTLVNNRVKEMGLFTRPFKENGEVEIAFTLSNNGTLLDDPYISKSNNPKLDLYALKALEQALPFPPFPKDVAQKTKKFKITLVY